MCYCYLLWLVVNRAATHKPCTGSVSFKLSHLQCRHLLLQQISCFLLCCYDCVTPSVKNNMLLYPFLLSQVDTTTALYYVTWTFTILSLFSTGKQCLSFSNVIYNKLLVGIRISECFTFSYIHHLCKHTHTICRVQGTNYAVVPVRSHRSKLARLKGFSCKDVAVWTAFFLLLFATVAVCIRIP